MSKLFACFAAVFMVAITAPAMSHHMAPDEVSAFIEDQLIAVESPHLLTSDDDPSLLTLFPQLADVDYVAVVEQVDIVDVLAVVADILDQLSKENEVCDYAMIIDADDSGTYTVTVGVDFCDF